MSQSRDLKTPEPYSATPNDSSANIQAKLSTREDKRAAKAAERRRRSNALKEEGNDLFHNGYFQEALNRYQKAIDLHKFPQQARKVRRNICFLYFEAHEAADNVLGADPRSVKARYRRGLARKHMEMWFAAAIDFRMVLRLEPRNENVKAELDSVEEEMRSDPSYALQEEDDLANYSEHEAPTLDDDPMLGDSLSESSDCEHTGNGIPCKFYNRYECKNGHACRFSHAPDNKSVRDALGRNMCSYYLIGACKFGERCSYLHSKEHLSHKGWWSTTDGLNRERGRYSFAQKLNKAAADYNRQTKASQPGQTSRKQAKGTKIQSSRPGLGDLGSVTAAAKTQSVRAPQRPGMKSKKELVTSSSASWEGYESDDEYGNGLAMCGFTGQVEELLSYGVKPWDDEAWDVLDALHSH